MARLIRLVLFIALALTTSCRKPNEAAVSMQNTHSKTFQAQGVVISVKPRQKQVEIKHQDIPGYMPGMTMPFDVKDANELTGLEPGQSVAFRLIVTDTEGWIDQIRKLDAPINSGPTSRATNAATPAIGQPPQVPEIKMLNPGDVLPEYHFTNQLGQLFSTAQFKGQALAITFIFTRCPFPNFCPRTSADFADVQKQLSSRRAGPTNWHLLTISFDPQFDKPEVLNAYARGYGYDSNRWSFATGDLSQVTTLAAQCGCAFWRDETGGFSHNLRTVVVDASGGVRKILSGNTWTPEELVQEIVSAAQQRR